MARTKPELRIETLPISEVLPYAKNARLHSDAQVDLVAKSIADFGFVNPCLIDKDGVLIAGHCRVIAAQKLGLKTVPIIRLGYLTEQQARALRLADNALPALASWSQELIKAEIADLKLEGFDIALLGFPENQLRGWGITMGTDTENDPEDVPETPKNPVVRRGDRWILGDHVLVCGDATSKSDVAMCLDGAKADLVFTDPPYNVAYSGLGQNRLGTIENDNQSASDFAAFLGEAFERMAESMKSLASIYICHPDAGSAPKLAFENAFARHFQKSATIIWVKNAASMGWQDYRSRHEPILYGWKKGKGKHSFYGDRTKTTVWDISRDAQINYEHPTQKPVALSMEAIVNSSKPGDKIFDPFVGAGGVLISCEMSSRKFVGIDLDPRYIDVCILRWEKLSGKRSTIMDSSGRTFSEVSDERQRGRSGTRKSSRASGRGRSNSAGTPRIPNGPRIAL